MQPLKIPVGSASELEGAGRRRGVTPKVLRAMLMNGQPWHIPNGMEQEAVTHLM